MIKTVYVYKTNKTFYIMKENVMNEFDSTSALLLH